MVTDIKGILTKLKINKSGRYENHFYVIPLENSDEYAKFYTLLEENAINTEYPNFAVNSSNNTKGVTTYFEVTVDEVIYNLFLIADFVTGEYKLKIGEK